MWRRQHADSSNNSIGYSTRCLALLLFLFVKVTCSITLRDLLHLDPGVRILAENLTIIYPKKILVNGEEKLEEAIFTANKVDLINDKEHPLATEYPALVRSINRSVDPCDDFYSFVCDGWRQENPIDSDEFMTSQTEELGYNVLLQYKSLFENPQLFEKSRERKLMYDLYSKCMDYEERNRLKSKPFFEQMRRIRQAELKYVTDWLILLQPTTAFFDISVATNEYNSTMNILELWPQSGFLSEKYYQEDAYKNQLFETHNFLRAVIRLLSTDDTQKEFFSGRTDEIERRLASFLKTDSSIAMINYYTEDNKTDVTLKIRNLPEIFPAINISRYLYTILPEEVKTKFDLQNLTIRVRNVEALRLISQLVQRIDNQTLADYLDWKVIIGHLPYMDDRFKKVYEQFNENVYGVHPSEKRWEKCLNTAIQTFDEVSSALYVERFFDPQSIEEAHMMVKNLKAAFLELLNENKWMDEDTKEKARIKASAITEFIGYNPKIFDKNLTSVRYRGLMFDSSSTLYDIASAVSKWSFHANFLQLLETNTRDSFEFLASEVNAFYDPSQNQIALLAGMLQSPFFNLSLPRVLNYGSIGVVTGHEITHGFDNYGALFDEKGNRKNWWDKETMKNFENYAECFVEQYGNVTIDHLNVKIDGRRTEGENIADNGGMRSAIRAVKTLLNGNIKQKSNIRGLEDYTLIQLFFMNYGFTWCGNWRQETMLTEMASDNHSPDYSRVNVVLSNQPEFAEAFNCPASSKMVSKKRCILW